MEGIVMKKLKVLFLLFATALCLPIQAQDMFDESLRELERLNNITYDYVASFLEYPSNHENTLKVFRGLQDLSKFYDEQSDKRFELLSRFDNYKTREYVNQIEKNKFLIDAIDEFVGCVAGYVRAGAKSQVFDQMLKPLFESFGWNCKIIPMECQDIVFFEYSKDEFKMLLAYNTRPAPGGFEADLSGKYNDNQVECYTYFKALRKTSTFCSLVVRGGKYRLVEYKDNKETTYHNLTKASSKRIN